MFTPYSARKIGVKQLVFLPGLTLSSLVKKQVGCKEVYIGETKRILWFRLDDHWGYVINGLDTTTGSHFTAGPGHSLSDMSVTALERVRKNSDPYRKEREEYIVRKFNTVHRGMNRKI